MGRKDMLITQNYLADTTDSTIEETTTKSYVNGGRTCRGSARRVRLNFDEGAPDKLQNPDTNDRQDPTDSYDSY